MFALAIISLLACTSGVLAAENLHVVLQSQTSGGPVADPPGTESLPQRVDFRDMDEALNLDLLGVATGMCSLGGDCDACQYRDLNPCLVADRYGADTSICKFPAGFLGGSIPQSMLCGSGSSVDIFVNPSGDDARAGAQATTAAARLTAFRTRAGTLMLTVTARCGWLLVPSRRTEPSGTAAESPPSARQGQDPAGSVAEWVLLEGNASYGGLEVYFAAPVSQLASPVPPPQQQQRESLSQALQAADSAGRPQERYACYSVELPLRGLASSCQFQEIDLRLLLALKRATVMASGDEPDTGGGGEPDTATCVEGADVVPAEGGLSIRAPQAARRAQTALAADTAEATSGQEVQLQQESAQQLFSNGVAASMSYSAVLDPRSTETADWLQSLSRQFPVLAATPTHHRLSFLIGALRPDRLAGLPTNVAGAATPLLPAGFDLETCGRQAIDAVTSAVVSLLAAEGVTKDYVADVVCLKTPFSEVSATELPPCARDTSILLNVSLEIPVAVAGGSAATTLSSLAAAASRSSTSAGTSTSAAYPEALAETLVQAQLAAPWTCLSTESQMRMATLIQLKAQLPIGPGIEATEISSSAGSDGSAAAGDKAAPPVAPQPANLPKDSGPGSLVASPAASPPQGPRTTEFVAIAVAVTMALVVVLVAFIAVRNLRRAKAAAQQAATAAVTAAAAAGATAATGANDPTAAGVRGPGGLSPAGSPWGKGSTGLPPTKQSATPLGVEDSYMSAGTELDEPSVTAGRPSPMLGGEQQCAVVVTHQQQQQVRFGTGSSFFAAAPLAGSREGAVPWAGLGPWRSGEPPTPVGIATQVSNPALAAAAGAIGGCAAKDEASPRAGSNVSSSTYDSRVHGTPLSPRGGEGPDELMFTARCPEDDSPAAEYRLQGQRPEGGEAARPAEAADAPGVGPLRSPRRTLSPREASLPVPESDAVAGTPQPADAAQAAQGPELRMGLHMVTSLPLRPPERRGRVLRLPGTGEVVSATRPPGATPITTEAEPDSDAPFLPPVSGWRSGEPAGTSGRAAEGYASRAGGMRGLLSVARGLGARVSAQTGGLASRPGVSAAEGATLWTNAVFSPRLTGRASREEGMVAEHGPVGQASLETAGSRAASPPRNSASADLIAAAAMADCRDE